MCVALRQVSTKKALEKSPILVVLYKFNILFTYIYTYIRLFIFTFMISGISGSFLVYEKKKHERAKTDFFQNNDFCKNNRYTNTLAGIVLESPVIPLRIHVEPVVVWVFLFA